MSEWQQGTINIPKKDWSKLKSLLLKKYNLLIERDHKIASSLYLILKEEAKNKRNFKYREKAVLKLSKLNLSPGSINRIEDSLFLTEPVHAKKLFKPKKKHFLSATNKTLSLDMATFSISFDNTNRQVSWIVPEGNYAVMLTYEHVIAKEFFLILSRINWTKNTGGVIVGKDNFKIDNYVIHKFGPLGEKINPMNPKTLLVL